MVAIRTIVLPRRCLSLSLSLSLSSKHVPHPTSNKIIAVVRNSSLHIPRSPFSSSAKVDVEFTSRGKQKESLLQKRIERKCQEADVERSIDTIKSEADAEVSNKEDPGLHLREFMSHIAEVAPDFEFFLLPHQAKVTHLFRPKGHQNDWAALIVRTTDRDIHPRFARLQKPIDVLGWHMKTKQLYCFPSQSARIPPIVYVADAERYEIQNEAVEDLLRQSWILQSKRRQWDWLTEELFESRANKAAMESVNRIWSTLYEPINLSVQFSFRGAHNLLSLDGISVFQRKLAFKRPQHPYVGTTFTTKNDVPTALPFDTDVKLFVFALHEPISSPQQVCGPLVGVFLFPKQVLSERGYLSDPARNIVGMKYITLYTSGYQPKYTPAKRKALWQNQFYHDLSTESGRQEAQQALMQYLNDSKQNKCDIRADGVSGDVTVASTVVSPCSGTLCMKNSENSSAYENAATQIKSGLLVRQSLAMGRSIFLDHMAEHAPDFEFLFMPHESLVSCLFRPRHSNVAAWAPLNLRTRSTIGKYVRFSGTKMRTEFCRVLGFHHSQKQVYLFPEDIKTNDVAFYKGCRAHERFKLDNSDINTFLKTYWGRSEHRLRRNWFDDEVFLRQTDKLWAASLSQVWRSFYDPLSKEVSFPAVDCPANVLIDNRHRILHRKVVIDKRIHERTQYYVNIGRGMGHDRSPYSVHDDVDFYLACIYESESKTMPGFYLFPRHYLADRGYLADPENAISGKRVTMLYPPWCKPSFEWTKEQQESHNEYFLSTQNEDEIRQSSNRFLQILESSSRGRFKTYSA